MKKMTSDQVRAAFLQFFAERGHSVQPSSSLVPADDPTLLFVNSGMAPFKNVFLGRETRPYQRAVSTQRCVRAGGKHNDLENVGYTARHHTFFEMLGNFSFGDYFKRDAIHFAWEFLTQTLQIPAEKLWVTVFDDDADAAGIWLEEIKIDPSRFSAIGSCDNFWAMGDVGPCGPCSEIFYDHGESVAGGPPGSADQEGDRYIEIWNLVFMQYNRDANGELHPLPQPSVDTGMGLERISAVLQGVHNNYQIDLFQNLLAAAAKLTSSHDLTDSSLRVIADHIRASAFMIMDGVLPANEGRGYVLRRIIRRAVRHGYRLGVADIFFYKLVAPLAQQMGSVFPEIKQTQDKIEQVLQAEEQRFGETLQQGMKILESHLAQLDGTVISGDIVFLLYDTYGFPLDLTADFAREHQLTVDRQGFEVEMAQQRRRARAAGKFAGDHALAVHCDGVTDFVGYELLGGSATISHLFAQNAPVSQLNCGENGTVILEQTPFYAEGGGQVGDSGTIKIGDGVFAVQDTQKQAGNFLHHGKVASGVITCGKCEVAVDAKRRHATECNHSATHLLHAALRQVLGEHVLQKGSLVDQHKLRFDFAHFAPVSTAQIGEVENIINSQIRLNNPAIAKTMSQAQALATGAMALFGEKYGDEVRVLTIGDFSYELCGGTHVKRTGAIGCLKIIGETGVASGVRRIEALTGQVCLDWIAEQNQYLASIGELLKIPAAKTLDKVQQLLAKNKQLAKELQHCHTKLGSNSGGQLADSAVLIDGIKVVAAIVDVGDAKALRSKVDQLKNQLGKVAVVLGAVADDKVILVAGVSKGETGLLSAGELVNFVASKVGGKGGGRADLAQAGGNDPAALDAALLQVPVWVQSRLAAQN